MAKDGFDMSEFDDFADSMLKLAEKQMPKSCKKFLRDEGNDLRNKVKNLAKSTVRKKTGNYIKGFKRGKIIYSYGDVKYNIRVYNSSNHAHLIENGHVQWSGGKQVGFTKGKHILEKASKLFEDEFEKHTKEFIGKTLEEGLHY